LEFELIARYEADETSLGLWLAPMRLHKVHDNGFNTRRLARRRCHERDVLLGLPTAAAMLETHALIRSSHGKRQCVPAPARTKSASGQLVGLSYNFTLKPSLACAELTLH
jgi:hypothetical protein